MNELSTQYLLCRVRLPAPPPPMSHTKRLTSTDTRPSVQRLQRECMLEYLRLHLRIAGATREGCVKDDRDSIFDAIPNLYRYVTGIMMCGGKNGTSIVL